MRFEASQAVFWSLSCYKELKKSHLQVIHLATSWSRCKIIISLQSSGMCRKQKFSFLSLKVKQQFDFYFLLSLLPSFFAVLASFFFSFAEHLVGFILVEKVFWKAFRILVLGERKCREAVKQDFHGNFQLNVAWFFAIFSGVLDWIELILEWFERPLHSLQVSRQSCLWPLKLITSQVVEGAWICTGS